jgi:hypothetical protein
MAAGYDAEVAELFRDLRAASKLSETDLAARIATPIEVVQALEHGAIYALPPWPETARVVNAYGTLLNLDTRPLLRRIYAQLEAGIVELGPKTVPDVPVMPAQGDSGPAQAPRPQAPQAPAWPNGHQAAPPPQASQPQAPHPEAPQQAGWPGGTPQFSRQAPPGGPWPTPQAPQPQRQSQDYPPAYQPPPQSYRPDTHPRDAYPPEPAAAPLQQEDASFPGDAAFAEPELDADPTAEPKAKRPALLKWGVGALVAAVALIGLWMAVGDSSSDPGASSGFDTSDPVLDPDDPRSRKADRLPNNF